jgi:hypothetical protein
VEEGGGGAADCIPCLVQPQGFLLAVAGVLRGHAAGSDDVLPIIGRTHSSFDHEAVWSAISKDCISHSPWRQQVFQCNFAEGVQGLVEVYPAPVKSVARMLEKLSK